MNKKYYVAPSSEVIGLQTASVLAGSVPGYKPGITEDEGDEELGRKKGFGNFSGCPWSDSDMD